TPPPTRTPRSSEADPLGTIGPPPTGPARAPQNPIADFFSDEPAGAAGAAGMDVSDEFIDQAIDQLIASGMTEEQIAAMGDEGILPVAAKLQQQARAREGR